MSTLIRFNGFTKVNKRSSGANAFAKRARSMTLDMRNKFSCGAVKGDIMSNQELAENYTN